MNRTSLFLASTIAMAIAGASASFAAEQQAQAPQLEKCYGVAKAGKNDCQTATSSCAGTSRRDHEAGSFVAVPKGTCDKIFGASLTPSKG